MLPLANIDPGQPTEQRAEPRASQPSFNPPTRPSLLPNNAPGSIMPGSSLYLHSALLSGVAGYVDAAGFASLVGLFPAHLTGEIVGDALALSHGHLGGHVTHLWMLPVFVGSVSTATITARLLRRSGRRAFTGLLALVTGALIAFSASDFLAGCLHEGWHVHMLIGGACAVAAMGFQNALMRESLSGSCPTTVMTGNLTHVVIDVVDHLFDKVTRPSKRDRRPHSRLLPVGSALFAFIACAVLGGFMTRFFGSLSVLLPTTLTAVLTVRAWREDRRQLALSVPAKSLAAAPLPTFDVWPQSLSPRAGTHYPPSGPVRIASARLPTPSNPELERQPMKRTASGTQLKTNFFDKE
ncbi:MAG TPA: YoaK family protein [Polyangiaceae bacterium]|nr:YoaK family protein [Polyangiaceae bacterium]